MARIDTKVTHGIGGHADTVFLRVLSDLNGLKIIRAHSRHSLTKKKSVPFCTSGVHRVYTILDEPKPPWDNTPNNPRNAWVSALDFCVETVGVDAAAPQTVLSAITYYLHMGHGLTYDIGTVSGGGGGTKYIRGAFVFHLSEYMNKTAGNVVNCYDQAGGVYVLSRLLGIPSEFVYMGSDGINGKPPFGYINR